MSASGVTLLSHSIELDELDKLDDLDELDFLGEMDDSCDMNCIKPVFKKRL